jgi:hypothetical protein
VHAKLSGWVEVWRTVKPRIKGLANFTYPGFLSWIHLYILALRPNNFTRKIAEKMLKDRNPRQTMFADKLKVRDYVSMKIGDKYLSNLLYSGTDLISLNLSALPSKYVIKPNHGSHAAIMVSPDYERSNQLPEPKKSTGWSQYFIHPNSIDKTDLIQITNYWLSLNYYKLPNKFHEWAYKNITPRIMIEEFLQGLDGKVPAEYRFFMFDGECELVYCYSDRFTNDKLALLSPTGQLIKGKYLGMESTSTFQIPKEFSTMLNLAKKLATGVNFVRVDLYLTDKGIVFSELTNYPMGALTNFKPKSLNRHVGKNWNLIETTHY